MSGFRSEIQKMNARALRSQMTMPEQILWHHLRAHRFLGLSVRRQAPIGPFIVDFLIPAQRLIIEIDGGHHGQVTDLPREQALRSRDYRMLRFWNSDIFANFSGVLQRIADEVHRDRSSL